MIRNSSIYRKTINKAASEIDVVGGEILITGATGLIGSCMIDVLLEANESYGKNFKIIAMGRNKDSLRLRFDKNNSSVNLKVQDVNDRIDIDNLDYVVHMASNADPKRYALDPVGTILTNIDGTKNILDCCKKSNSRMLYTSTFEVYGELNQDVYSEMEYGIIDNSLLRSCYPESKRVAELLVRSYVSQYNVDCVIARLSSVYGPNMKSDDSKAHAQFLKNALDGEDIVLKSKGSQRRTYCYVIDAVMGLLTVLFKGEKGEIYNVTNDKSITTISEVANIIADYVGKKVIYDIPDEIEKKGFSKPQNCILNTNKLKKLGWNGRYDIKSGLIETIDILKELEK